MSNNTETGLDRNVEGALSYLLGLITGILFLVIEDDDFVNFHASQSIVFSLAVIVVSVVLGVVQGILFAIPRLGGVIGGLFSLVYILFQLAVAVVWLFLMYQAYSNVRYKLPVLGDLAESLT